MEQIQNQIGVGVGDLQFAAGREVHRILKKARGSRAKAVELALQKLSEMDCISKSELEQLTKIFQTGFRTAAGKGNPESAYIAVRAIYADMLANGNSSPASLALAAASTGSYASVDTDGDTPVVVYKKSSDNWQDTLTAAGAVIGSAIPGVGVAVGAVVGGIVGKIVDDC
jgi:hypothetical protein